MNKIPTPLRSFLSGLQNGVKIFGDNMNEIVVLILATMIYVFGIGITAIFAKLRGKHFLDMQIHKKQKSYWEDLQLGTKETSTYHRQF